MLNSYLAQNISLIFTYQSRVLSLCLVMLAVSVGGCGRDQGEPPISTVSGTVTYQGKPVTGGTLTFDTTTENGALPFAGRIGADGQYKITNAIPGLARISVETATQEGLPTFFPLPKKFSDPSKSGLQYQIEEGSQQFNIVME